MQQDARPLDGDDGSDEDDDGPVAPNWEPASRDADPTSGNRSGSDILTMLVSIYGSKVNSPPPQKKEITAVDSSSLCLAYLFDKCF